MKNQVIYNLKTLVIIAMISLLYSCYYDVEEEIYPTIECAVDDVRYSEHVLPIIQNNCYSCHDANSNFGGVTLEHFDQLKRYVDNGKLLGVMKHQPGFSPMPKNAAQLVKCDIEKIEAWVNAGANDN